MSKPHIVSLKDLNGFESSTIIASQYGSGRNKSISINSFIGAISNTLKSKFVVKNNKTIVLECQSLSEAIEEYNKY